MGRSETCLEEVVVGIYTGVSLLYITVLHFILIQYFSKIVKN
jgi:hypothetical protein